MAPYHILLVDDDVLGTEALKEHLEGKGYRITTASCCAEAREALSDRAPIDVMVLDYMMPDGLGTELLQRIAEDEALQKPRVIVSSSWIDAGNPAWEALLERLPNGYKTLVQAFVNKPCSFERIDAIVNRVAHHGAPIPAKRVRTGDFQAPPPGSLPGGDTSAE